MRHLDTQVLWVQEAAARRELTIVKVSGVENPADMGTKHLAQREESKLPYHRRTVEDGVKGRTGDLRVSGPAATETTGREHRLRLARDREHG